MNQHNQIIEATSNNKFKGVWPALITPIDDNENPNFSELEKLTELIISQGMDGLYILGSTGQGFLLNEAQRKNVTEAVLATTKNRIPVMCQVGALTTKESVRLAEHASKFGASGISSVGPIYYGAGNEAMALKHYREIAKAGDLPFFPYQLGEATFSDGIKVFIDKLLAIPNVAGMKLTTSNLLQISAFSSNSGGALTLFSGADELMCHAAMCGTSGAIGSMYNLWGPECQKVRKAFLNGNISLGTSFMMTFQEVIIKILPNIWTFLQQAMQFRYGVDIGIPVAPLGNTNKIWEDHTIENLVEKVISAADSKVLQGH